MLVRVERILIASLGEETVAELQLDFGRLRRRRAVGMNDERRGRDQSDAADDADAALHVPTEPSARDDAGYERVLQEPGRPVR